MTFFRRTSSRLPFLIAVALIAAAIGDVLVETISNSGMLGSGYADSNHLSVVPTLIAGALLVILVISRRCIALLRHLDEHSEWLVRAAKQLSARSAFADLPLVLILQFSALFMMESCEQLCFGARLLGGTVWLGGPIWFSILTHALLGASCMLLVRRAIGEIVRRCAVLVGMALEFMLDAFTRENSGSFTSRRDSSRIRGSRTLRVAQIGQRAPPLLLALTSTI